LGPWAGRGDPHDAVTPLEGIKARAGAGTEVRYAKGCGILDSTTAGFAEAVALARQAEVALLVLGEAGDMSGEAASRSSLALPGVQQQLLEAERLDRKSTRLNSSHQIISYAVFCL